MKTPFKLLPLRQAGLTVLLLVTSGLLFAQTTKDPSSVSLLLPGDGMQAGAEEQKWPFAHLSLNAGGFLVMGPVLEIDFRIAKKSYLGLYYVNHYLGLFAGTLVFEGDPISFSPRSMGAGLFFKHYFLPNEKMNSLYAGFYLGYSFNEGTYHYSYPNEGVERIKDILLFGSGGYRWNVGKRLYVLAGVQFGIAYSYEDKYYRTYSFDETTGTFFKKEYFAEEYSAEAYPYGLPEITIGIKF
ncbi:MAG: hypothetical protein JXR66_06195 [Bacteroidales bacterium]|nr:hypothetical protein [Bacteroidales bacterium]